MNSQSNPIPRLFKTIQGFLFWYRYIRILDLLKCVSGSLRLRLNQAASAAKATINAAGSVPPA